MTEESSTVSHLSAAMTTADMTQASGKMTPSSSPVVYFRIILLVIGVVGTVTNGLILYALVASKQHKKNVLIVNQNALDFFTSLMMVIVYSLKLGNINLTGSAGYWLCILLLSDSLVWTGTSGSVINLASITVDRYLKVVHHTWSKTKLKNWMIYSVMVFSWIGSLGWTMAGAFSTTMVMDGVCYPHVIWKNDTARMINAIWNFGSFYVLILFIFIFCYWRILVVIRRQAKVMAGHAAAGPSTTQAQTHKMQSNVTKTMIFVSALYAITWLPVHIYGLYIDLNQHNQFVPIIYYGMSIFAFMYMCTNPFVYATKFDPVRKVLLRLIACKKNSD